MAEKSSQKTLKIYGVLGILLFVFGFVLLILSEFKGTILTFHDIEGVRSAENMSLILRGAFVILFFWMYRRNNLPQLLFGTTIPLLAFFVIFHLWGFQHVDQSVYVYYYAIVNLWAPLTMGFFFWALANQVVTWQEAKLAYPLLVGFSEVGILLGQMYMSGVRYGENLDLLMRQRGVVLLGVLLLLCLGGWATKKYQLTHESPTKDVAPLSLSFRKHYLSLILVITVDMGFCYNLINFLFKAQVKSYAVTDNNAYVQFMQAYDGYAVSMSMVLFLLTFWMVWKLGWLKGALLSPLFVLLSTGLLLACAWIPDLQVFVKNMTHLPAFVSLISLQAMMGKGFAVIFFATQKMAYIPLDVITRTRGLLLIGFLFAGFGTVLGRWTSQLLLVFSHKPGEVPLEIFLCVIFAAGLLWLGAVLRLGKMCRKAMS